MVMTRLIRPNPVTVMETLTASGKGSLSFKPCLSLVHQFTHWPEDVSLVVDDSELLPAKGE